MGHAARMIEMKNP